MQTECSFQVVFTLKIYNNFHLEYLALGPFQSYTSKMFTSLFCQLIYTFLGLDLQIDSVLRTSRLLKQTDANMSLFSK